MPQESRWITGYTTAANILKDLATQICTSADTFKWDLAWPTTGADLAAKISSITDGFVIKSKTSGDDNVAGSGIDVYIEFKKPAKFDTTKDNNAFLQCRFGQQYDPATQTWAVDSVSEWATWSWFRRSCATLKSWLPVSYWLNINADHIVGVLMGDPNASFDDYLISFGYFGKINKFSGGDADVSGNFGMSVSSDISPTYATTYGEKTGTGITDITMLKTRSGFPFQAHLASFTTPDEFADRHVLGPSGWTHKYHMSPIYVYHGVDNYRGELIHAISTDRASVVHLDEMIIDKGLQTEKVYQYFALNAPYSMFNNSPNVLYGVAILKSQA